MPTIDQHASIKHLVLKSVAPKVDVWMWLAYDHTGSGLLVEWFGVISFLAVTKHTGKFPPSLTPIHTQAFLVHLWDFCFLRKGRSGSLQMHPLKWYFLVKSGIHLHSCLINSSVSIDMVEGFPLRAKYQDLERKIAMYLLYPHFLVLTTIYEMLFLARITYQ